MHKQQIRDCGKQIPSINDDVYVISSLIISRHAKENVPQKPSRDDVSRCIGIWASIYLGPDSISRKGDRVLRPG